MQSIFKSNQLMKNSKSGQSTQRVYEKKFTLQNKQVLLIGEQQIDDESLLILRNPQKSQQGNSNQKEYSQTPQIVIEIENISCKTTVSSMFTYLSHNYSNFNHLQNNWITSGKIHNLCTIFRSSQYKNQLKLDITHLFNTMINLELENSGELSIGVYLIEQEIMFSLIKLWSVLSKNKSVNSNSINCLIDRLLIIDSQQQIILQGGFTHMIDQIITTSKQNHFGQSQIYPIVHTCSLLASYLSPSATPLPTKLHFQFLILSLLDELLQSFPNQSIKFYSQFLSLLNQIFRIYYFIFFLDTQSQELFVEFVKYRNLFTMVVMFGVGDNDMKVKQMAWIIIALLTSCDIKQMQLLFEQLAFIDKIIQVINNIDHHHPLNEKIKEKILLCIGNLADYGDHMIKYIIKNPIVNFLIDEGLQNHSQKIKINSYYALTRTVRTSNLKILNEIINNIPIPDLLVQGLISCKSDRKLVQEIIEALNYLIQKNSETNNKLPQLLKDRLQSKYNFSFISQLAQFKIHKYQSHNTNN